MPPKDHLAVVNKVNLALPTSHRVFRVHTGDSLLWRTVEVCGGLPGWLSTDQWDMWSPRQFNSPSLL